MKYEVLLFLFIGLLIQFCKRCPKHDKKRDSKVFYEFR